MLGERLPLVPAGRVEGDLTPAESIHESQVSQSESYPRPRLEASPGRPGARRISPPQQCTANRIGARDPSPRRPPKLLASRVILTPSDLAAIPSSSEQGAAYANPPEYCSSKIADAVDQTEVRKCVANKAADPDS